MGKKNLMISQQAKSIAASAVIGGAKAAKNGKTSKPSGITKLREINHSVGTARHYSFAFFVGALISLIAAFTFGFMLGVFGAF